MRVVTLKDVANFTAMMKATAEFHAQWKIAMDELENLSGRSITANQMWRALESAEQDAQEEEDLKNPSAEDPQPVRLASPPVAT